MTTNRVIVKRSEIDRDREIEIERERDECVMERPSGMTEDGWRELCGWEDGDNTRREDRRRGRARMNTGDIEVTWRGEDV